MSFIIPMRSGCDNAKSPLKVVSPIIKKYAEQRQKRTLISRKLDRHDPATKSNRTLKAILPKTDGEVEPVEPELIGSVNPEAPSIITTNHLPDEIAQPVQEICAIAKLVAEDAKHFSEKTTPLKIPRKKSGASTGGTSKKKLLKQGKLVESAFELLKPEPAAVINAREQAYAENYFRRVNSAFSGKNEDVFLEFCTKMKALGAGETNVVTVYNELVKLFAGHRDLIEDFIPFLSSEQALECGVFMEHLLSTKMIDFLSLIEVHFAKTPNQIKKIHAALEKLVHAGDIGIKQLSLAILPLLKGNAVLTDFFLELLPSAPPPSGMRTDFEDLDEEGMSDGSDGNKTEIWEKVELPNIPDPYGGVSCICSCHDVENEFKPRLQHCVPCSKKFINGKIFIHSGKFFRRGTITFKDHDMDFHKNRLLPNPSELRKRKRSSAHSPSKSATASSDDHKSDLEEDDRVRGLKTPKSKVGKFSCKSISKIEGVSKDDASKEKLPCIKSLKLPDDINSSEKNFDCIVLSPNRPIDRYTLLEDDMVSIFDCHKESRNSPEMRRASKEEIKQKASPGEKWNRWQEMDNDEVPSGSDTVTFVTASQALALKSAESEVKPEALEWKISSPKEVPPKVEEVAVEPNPPILLVIPAEPDSTPQQFPPIISIPESNSILFNVDPFLTTLENTAADSVHSLQLNVESSGVQDSTVTSPKEKSIEEAPWKLEEDRVVLHTLQTETYSEETFVKIQAALPSRTVISIKKRFQELLNILYQMKAETSD